MICSGKDLFDVSWIASVDALPRPPLLDVSSTHLLEGLPGTVEISFRGFLKEDLIEEIETNNGIFHGHLACSFFTALSLCKSPSSKICLKYTKRNRKKEKNDS